MGVPTLLMLLEPNVVWQHASSHVSSSHGNSTDSCSQSGFVCLPRCAMVYRMRCPQRPVEQQLCRC
jgi:hypothetical protein